MCAVVFDRHNIDFNFITGLFLRTRYRRLSLEKFYAYGWALKSAVGISVMIFCKMSHTCYDRRLVALCNLNVKVKLFVFIIGCK